MSDRGFVTGAKAETQQRDWNRLREAIRAHDPEATEAAGEKCERWVSTIPPRALTGQDAAKVLLAELDTLWSAELSTATDNGRRKAERGGHKYRVIDREGFRAALRAIGGET